MGKPVAGRRHRRAQVDISAWAAVVTGTVTELCHGSYFRTMVGAVPGTYNLETVLLGGPTR